MDKITIEANDRSTLPRVILIVSPQGRLEGMVKRRDILRGLEPGFMQKRTIKYSKKWFDINVDPDLSTLSDTRILQSIRKNASRCVVEVMQPIVTKVAHNDTFLRIISEMVEHNCSLIPVLDAEKVVGVVRSVDVLHQIAPLVTHETDESI